MRMNKFLPATLFLCLWAPLFASATPFLWTNDVSGNASGSWAVPLNWLPTGVPGAGDTANFSALDITVDSIITLDGNQSIDALLFGDLDPSTNSAPAGWTINGGLLGGATLTLAGSASSIVVDDLSPGQSVTINVPLRGNGGLMKVGAGTLRLGANNDYTGGTAVGRGTLEIGTGSATGSVPADLHVGGGTVVFNRADDYIQEGLVFSTSTNSILRTAEGSGPTTLTFAEGLNVFGAIQNPGASRLLLKASANTTNFFPGPNSGAPNNGDGVLRNTSDNGSLTIDGGTWVLNGANWSLGVGNMFRGSTTITNATLVAGGARYMRGILRLEQGGSLLVTNSANLAGGSANISRLSFEGDPPPGDITGIYVSDGALLDVWAGGFALDIGPANATRGSNCVSFIHQRGGMVLRGVNGVSSGGNGRAIFIGSPNPEHTGYYTLEGGKLICTDLIGPRFSAPQYISTNYFSWSGGLLSCRTFEARLLVGGALTNAGGILAPGDIGLAASTTINGNYVVSSSNAVLAIDLGGRIAAAQAAGVVGVSNAYDNIRQTIGDIQLGGRLEVRFIAGFENDVTPADSFTIVNGDPTHSGVSGTFSNVENGRVPIIGQPGRSFRVTSTGTSVVLDDITPLPPRLAARLDPPNVIVLSWPTNNTGGFVLQLADDLTGSLNWINAAGGGVEVEGTNYVFEFTEGLRRFFRLHKAQ
jgi:autotransporter-associated beta strand protein